MMFGMLFALAAAQSAGVLVEDTPQIGIATRHARCIVRQVGVAPAAAAARAAKVAEATRGCREFTEGDFTQGRVMLGDRPVNARWWSRMRVTLDAIEADIAAAIVQPKQYKIIWELPDGGRVDAYNAPEPLKSVRLLTVPF